MKRGEIWWASLGPPLGSSPAFRRPVVIVQANPFNESRIQTIIVVAVNSNLALTAAPGNFAIPSRESGLPRKSAVNVSQIVTLDKKLLTQRIGRLAPASLARLDAGLRLVLSLQS